MILRPKVVNDDGTTAYVLWFDSEGKPYDYGDEFKEIHYEKEDGIPDIIKFSQFVYVPNFNDKFGSWDGKFRSAVSVIINGIADMMIGNPALDGKLKLIRFLNREYGKEIRHKYLDTYVKTRVLYVPMIGDSAFSTSSLIAPLAAISPQSLVVLPPAISYMDTINNDIPFNTELLFNAFKSSMSTWMGEIYGYMTNGFTLEQLTTMAPVICGSAKGENVICPIIIGAISLGLKNEDRYKDIYLYSMDQMRLIEVPIFDDYNVGRYNIPEIEHEEDVEKYVDAIKNRDPLKDFSI